jgi:two-component sensor histidine kinase
MRLLSLFEHLKIRTKLFILISIMIFLISIFIVIFYPAAFVKQAYKEINTKAQSIAEMMAFSLSPALFFEDVEAIEEVFQSAKQNTDLLYIVILEKSGKPVSFFNRAIANNANYLEAKNNNYISSNGMIYRIMKPILYRNQEIGQLYLGLSLKELREKTAGIRVNIALQSLIIFVVGMIALYGISTIITRPLRKMTETAERISKGDMEHRASVSSKDEVGQLAESFNKMVDNLINVHNDLESVYNELADEKIKLEKKVEDRTKELQREIHDREWAEGKVRLALDEKEILLHKLHDSVKYSMKVMSDLFELQGEDIKDKGLLGILRENRSRINTIALIHDKFYRSLDFTKVDFKKYVMDLTSQLFNLYAVNRDVIQLKINIDSVFLNHKTALACGLILNELVSNSIKHGFHKGRRGEVGVELYFDGRDVFTLIVSNNGVKLPKDFEVKNPETFGLKMVNKLTDQLHGVLEVNRYPETSFIIAFAEIL